jgi:hypothetical protein
MKLGTVVVVKATGQLGVVEAIYPPNHIWAIESLYVRTHRNGDPVYFLRPEVTQIYRARDF